MLLMKNLQKLLNELHQFLHKLKLQLPTQESLVHKYKLYLLFEFRRSGSRPKVVRSSALYGFEKYVLGPYFF